MVKQLIYLAWKQDEYIINFTHDVVFEIKVLNKLYGYQCIKPLTGYLAFGLIDFLIRETGITGRIGVPINLIPSKGIMAKLLNTDPKVISNDLKRKFAQILKRVKINQEFVDEELAANKFPNFNLPDRDELESLFSLIQGRFLYADEIMKLLQENKQVNIYSLPDLLQYLHLIRGVKKIPAITLNEDDEYICNRCGQTSNIVESSCPTCGENCCYCEECIQMGESRLCQVIYAVESRGPQVSRRVVTNFDFKLSPAQREVSQGLVDFLSQQTKEYALIWAVCGAGKTEVSYAAIKDTLQKGGKVLFAIPRRDVVAELEPRIKKAFPKERVIALFGGSTNKYLEADIILATTHQTIRFYRAFDLIVLDEADAYPYAGSNMLYQSVERAKKENGRIIYMTATPNKELFKKRPFCLKLPVRYHGRPLPVPELRVTNNKEGLTNEAVDFIKSSISRQQRIFVFVPKVAMAKEVGQYLQSIFGEQVQYSSSADKKRDEKRIKFAQGEFKIFVTTTIMERGITVPKVNVLVLCADYERIFDEATLVQMAGRAGRVGESHDEVIYLATRVSQAMRTAIKNIKAMNKEAEKKGYIKG